MRILYVSHSFPLPDEPLSNIGGMQRVATELYVALREHPGVETRSLLLETSWATTGLRTLPFLLGLLRRIPRLVREEKVDIVLFSSMVTASVVPLIRESGTASGARTAAIPVGRDVTLPNFIYQRFVPRVLRSLDLVLPISRATADACLERGADPSRTHVVPCGVDFGRMKPGEDRTGSRRRLLDILRESGHAVPAESRLLLSVGRHQERKGFHWFVEEVMPRLGSDFVYLLAGSGPMTSRIEQAITRSGSAERVRLLGQVSEEALRALYGGADLFVMPNVSVAGDIEGFGVVMLEAGAAGLPVVAADLEGIRDVIAEGKNGTLVPSAHTEEFVAAIRRYSDPATLTTASSGARDYVTARFSWAGVVEQYLELFRAVSAGRG